MTEMTGGFCPGKIEADNKINLSEATSMTESVASIKVDLAQIDQQLDAFEKEEWGLNCCQ